MDESKKTGADNQSSILKYQLAVAELRKGDNPLSLAHAVRHLGDAYYYAGQQQQAEPCYVAALSIYRCHKDKKSLDFANALRSFAVLKEEISETDGAESLWLEAHDLYVFVNVSAGVAESAARLALLARRRGDLQQSRGWLDGAIAAADRIDDTETMKFVREVRAEIEG